MASSRPITQRARFLLASGLIIGLTLWVRIYNLYALPVFVDEGNHLLWAQRFAVGNTYYPLLMDGKILFGALLSLFQVVGPAALWIGRAFIALFATLGCSATIATARYVGSSRVGLLAGLLYAFLPFAVFHDRQLLSDPLMADFGAVALFFALRAAGPRGWRAVPPLALSLAAALLSKLFGITYVVFLGAAALLLPGSWKERRVLIGRYAASGVLGGVLIGLFLITFSSRLGFNDATLMNQGVGFVGCPAIVCEGDLDKQLSNLQGAWDSVTDFVPHYFGWSLVALAAIAWPVAYPRERRKVAVLSLSTLAILTVLMLGVGTGSDVVLPARYITMLTLPLTVLAAYSLLTIAERATLFLKSPSLQQNQPLPVIAASSLMLLIVGVSMTNMVPMLANPRAGGYPAFDLWQYFEGRYGGYGFYEAVSTIKEREQDSVLPPVILVYGEYTQMVGAYFDRTRVDVRAASEVYPRDIGQWLMNGQSIYLIDEIEPNLTLAGSSISEHGMMTNEIIRYMRHPYWGQEWAVRLRVATGADPELRQILFPDFFIRPEKLTGDFEALVASLPGDKAATLLVYPPNQVEALAPLLAASHPNLTLAPIGDSWPLDTAAAADQLAQLTAGSQPVFAAFVEETKGDPQRFLETWLTTHLFRLNEQWFGPVRRVAFAPNAPPSQSVAVQGTFGEAIVLNSIDLLETEVPPGGLVRLRIQWQALAPIAQQFKVFTHIFAGERIIAQHDGQPVGELRPTTTWQTGETIADQFAIQLPSDAPPGSYQLRIGLYELESQARLPLLLPDGSTNEFFVGGTVTVK